MSPIDLKDWWPRYGAIVEQFNYSMKTDQEATDLLSGYIMKVAMPLEKAEEIVRGKHVVICGAGPSIHDNLIDMMDNGLLDNTVIFAADGATTACLELDVVPHFILTDLDGRIEDIEQAHQQGTVVIIHAHGDNIPKLKSWVPRLLQGRLIMGSTQIRPRPDVHNLGGFTDGDRCVFWAEGLYAKKIALLGMDLGKTVGKYSKPELTRDVLASPVKRQKLLVAKELIAWLATWTESQIINLTGLFTSIPGVPNQEINKFTWKET
ncbi:MAG: 6-hydroxymethylpterin diphosphokinase MptE-like protein [Candidatus Thorarchaeota archaeon]